MFYTVGKFLVSRSCSRNWQVERWIHATSSLYQLQSTSAGNYSSKKTLLEAVVNRSSWGPFSALPAARTFSTMPPVKQLEDVVKRIDEVVKENAVALFSKSYCPFCKKVKNLFDELNQPFWSIELDLIDKDEAALMQDALKQRTGMSTVPNVFVKGQHIGGCDDTYKFHDQKKLMPLLKGDVEKHDYQYDLVVIGGGSGGLAASKAAAKLGKKVACLDFVKPTPKGTTWGLGGTCVNVGCIPKKLMHQSALVGLAIQDATAFGWQLPEERTHNWETMVEAIQMYIASLNWGYRVALREATVTYLNEYGEFLDEHTLLTTNKKKQQKQITSKDFLIAVGGRPRYPEIPGAREYAITSDDIFSLPYNPGKTLCVGASYIALENAGFLAGFGIDTTVMVRSILLRGFDQQIAEMIGEYMEGHGVKFVRGFTPVSIEQVEEGTPPLLKVTSKCSDTGEIVQETYNTVFFAIGRDPCTDELNLQKAGVALNPKSGKILTNESDQSSVPHIYAIGDVAEGRPELTPVAIQAGNLLAQRLYAGKSTLTEYDKIPTTVFTPIEYGSCGFSEEAAIEKFGDANIEVYHTNFQALEHTLPKRDENKCYAKLVVNKQDNERVVGFHYMGPNAGEVTQGFALGMKLNATKDDFDGLIGIHPTCAEVFTTLTITKSSGQSAMKTGC